MRWMAVELRCDRLGGAGRQLPAHPSGLLEPLGVAAQRPGVASRRGLEPLQAAVTIGPEPTVDRGAAEGALDPIGVGVDAGGQLPDDGAPLGGAEMGAYRRGDDPVAEQGDGFGSVGWVRHGLSFRSGQSHEPTTPSAGASWRGSVGGQHRPAAHRCHEAPERHDVARKPPPGRLVGRPDGLEGCPGGRGKPGRRRPFPTRWPARRIGRRCPGPGRRSGRPIP
jgi:hypothetical protein